MAQYSKSGSYTFNLEVSYKQIETGTTGKKPLIVYMHGYKQNIQYFEKKCEALLAFKAHHLFIQAPYPVYDETRNRSVEQWGRAWYLYDGEQGQFIDSMEKTSLNIEKLIKKVKKGTSANHVAVLGYSMGGYLAGYFTLSRPQLVNDLIVVGGRIKIEHFREKAFKNLRALHLHGKEDQSVASESARESCEKLAEQKADASFLEIDAGHRLTNEYITEIKQWMINKGYILS